MNRASELDTELDHDADPEHVHEPEPVLMIGHRHTPAPAQQGAPTGAAGGRLGCALALGQRRTRGPELDTELDHEADPVHVHRPKPALVIDHRLGWRDDNSTSTEREPRTARLTMKSSQLEACKQIRPQPTPKPALHTMSGSFSIISTHTTSAR